MVYAKPPFGGPEQVLKYLARYTHRVAISNSRLLALEDGKVRFRWKDYARGNKPGIMTLAATEFIRRFLMHVMPARFVRIRYYGFMANRHRAENLTRCRQLLGEQKPPEAQDGAAGDSPLGPAYADPTPGGNEADRCCPHCHQGAGCGALGCWRDNPRLTSGCGFGPQSSTQTRHEPGRALDHLSSHQCAPTGSAARTPRADAGEPGAGDRRR